MRVLELSAAFRRTRLHLAPIGSAEDVALRLAIRRLTSELHAIPAPGDIEAFRTPIGTCWRRPLRGAQLFVEYMFEPPLVRVLALIERS